MKQFLLTIAGVFVGLVLFMVIMPMILIFGIVGLAQKSAEGPTTPSAAVLQLDLRTGLTDQDPQNPFAIFGGGGHSVISVIEKLKAAEKDDKVKGVFVRLPEGGMPPAAADELRQAFIRFRASGKPMMAHSQGLYPSGAVTSTYMLAAATGDVWMQPGAAFQATGMAVEDMFFKRAFDKYGVKADFEQRKEYKNAVNPYLHDDYTPAHKEAQLSWMGSIYRTSLVSAAADRKLAPQAMVAAIEGGPWSASQALDRKLIDRVGQVKEASDALLAKAGKNAKLMDFEDYTAKASEGSGQSIAVIGAEGAIMTGTSGGGSPFGGDTTVWSDDVAKAIYDAAEDKTVKAIVFRVSSPGGSDTASEQILAAVKAARAAGKPVVVSMGTYAASGGYWISSQADSIVAQPTTLTGSIGVYGGKFVLGDALGRFGVDVRETSVGGDYAGAFGTQAGFDPGQKAAFGGWMDTIYEGFVKRVAEGRKMPAEKVRELAKGRVWTGAQARQLGLVDRLGGFYDAVDEAKRLAGIKGDVKLKVMGGPKSPFEALERMFGVSSASLKTLAAAAWIFGDPRAEAVMDHMAETRLRERGATVLSPRYDSLAR
ncbi:MAG: signal peptide peptidase SppA [Caulobacter sp.]|nr:signal peptide peptidase SppA [Caulobacter sp.]